MSDQGVGNGTGLVVPRSFVTDGGLGSDVAAVTRTAGQQLADTGLGADAALITPLLAAADQAAAADAALLGVLGGDQGAGTDSGLVIPRSAAVDRAAGTGLGTVMPRMACADGGAGSGLAIAGFTPHSPASASWAAAGTYTFTIPVWCRYIDVVLLGAGGGGASSGPLYTWGGYPGEAGVYATTSLERGVHIPWTAIFITLTVGTGGARGSGGVTGTEGRAGGSTVLTYTNLAGATVTVAATGGAGGIANLTGTTDNTGRSPGNHTYNGQVYTGGAAQSTAGSAGNPPGGGGAGGRNFGGAGGVGAPGGAWCRAYQ
ncbi:hypothetical protein [Mycolicibacterium sp.]|uniref:glycine-rich domain-containing protein n=1 Tax=Mycolicibacterium sp. TaxID=2320850 RepID=UPI0037C8A3A1